MNFENNTTHKVYRTLVKMVGSFEKAETLSEKYTEGKMDHDGATTQVGQYKFINGNRVVYVLWGNGAVPAEITGTVKVTDIYGFSQTINASAIKTSDSPFFIERQ